MSSKTLNIVLPEELVKQADKVAKAESRNRSELIREALRQYIKKTEQEEWEDLLRYGRAKGRELGIKSEEDVAKIVRDFRRENR